MKNKTASIIYGIISLCSAGYYIALKTTDPSFTPSFTDCWLLLALLFGFFFFLIRKRPPSEKYHVLSKWPRWARITLFSFLIICGGIACVNVCFICTPKTIADIEQTDVAEPRYVIVLGGGIKHDGTLGNTPKQRIKVAASYLTKHPEAKAIVTGGLGKFAPGPEAPVLAAELASYGIDNSRILQEDQALDTIQNFSYSTALIVQDENNSSETPVQLSDVLSQPIIVVTSDFHLRRAERLASRMGFTQVYGIASPTPALFVLNSYCREICSYVKLNLRILLTGKPTKLQTI